VNESKPLDEGINGRSSPRKGFVWLESSFVGTKPIDSPGSTEPHALMLSSHRSGLSSGHGLMEFGQPKKSSLQLKQEERAARRREQASTQHHPPQAPFNTTQSPYISRNGEYK